MYGEGGASTWDAPSCSSALVVNALEKDPPFRGPSVGVVLAQCESIAITQAERVPALSFFRLKIER